MMDMGRAKLGIRVAERFRRKRKNHQNHQAKGNE